MSEVRITVTGQPAPQGSKRAIINKHTGRPALIESSKDRLQTWRGAVVEAAALQPAVTFDPAIPLTVRMVFTLRRPKSHYRTGRNAHLLRDNAPPRPATKPDLSKLARATEDALTDAGTWHDDAQVTEYERLAKVWCGEDPEALHVPGATITIRTTKGNP
jgi:Holliday junction resolvase RusA-like endonuclease